MYNYSPEFLFLSCTLYLVQIVLRNRGEFSPEWAPQKIVSIFSTRLPHYHVSRRHSVAQKYQRVPALSSPLPRRADGCTACKPQLTCDTQSPAAPHRLLHTAPRLVSKSHHHDHSSNGTTGVLTSARARSQAPGRLHPSYTHTYLNTT